MLVLPLKVTKPYDLSEPLASWIDSCSPPSRSTSDNGGASQNCPDFTSAECRDDLLRLSSLRHSISSSIRSPNSHGSALADKALEDCFEYHAALKECERRGFPQQDGLVPDLRLQWDCAFDSLENEPQPAVIRSNIRYERACVLFNIAAFESYLASKEDRSTKPGLTKAVSRYQTAAALLSHLRTEVMSPPSGGGEESSNSPPPVDLTVPALLLCEKLLLAQGQQCSYLLAGQRARPMHLLLAKIAIGTAELYNETLTYSQDPVVKSRLPGMSDEWGTHLKTLGMFFRAKAEHHESVSAKEKSHWGKEIARLIQAEGMVRQTLLLGRSGACGGAELAETVAEAESLEATVGQRREQAERDNAETYHEDVPDMKDLQPIRGQNLMTKRPKLPEALEPESLEKPMFAHLLGSDAKKAANRFVSDLSELLERSSSLVKSETEKARNALAEVSLPQSLAAYNEASSGTGGVPPNLWDRIQVIQQNRAVENLKGELWELKDMSELARGVVADLARQLEGDLEMDRLFREEHPDFDGHKAEEVQASVRQNMKSCQGWLENARNGDNVLLRMLETFEVDPKFKLLQCNRAQLDRLIPAPTGPAIDTSELSNLLVELSNLIREREMILGTLREESRNYNIRSKLADVDARGGANGADGYEEAVQMSLSSFKGLVLDIQVNIDKQPQLMDSILAENTIFVQARDAGGDSGSPSGENCVQMIEEAITTIERVKKQLGEGRNFYEVVMPRLEQLKQQVSEISVRLTVERCDWEEKFSIAEQRRKQEIKDAEMAKELSSPASSGGGGGASQPSGAGMSRESETSFNRGFQQEVSPGQSGNPGISPPMNGPSASTIPQSGGGPISSSPPSPMEPPRPLFREEMITEAPSTAHGNAVSDNDNTHNNHKNGDVRPPIGQPGVSFVSNSEPQVRVDDEKVASLVAMDFDPEKVVRALKKYDNNLEQALNELLSC